MCHNLLYRFIKARETGIMKQQQMKWMPRIHECDERKRMKIVTAENLRWAYVILLIGVLFSIVIALFEKKFSWTVHYYIQ